MFVTRNWYVAARSGEMGDKPFSRTICDRRVAFFRDADGTARAVSAICPHRGIDLGQGRVIDGDIVCPFHGFRFASGGQCTQIPSQEADRPIPSHIRVSTYAVVEQQGLLWLWPEPDDVPDHPPTLYDFLDPAVMPRAYHQEPVTFGASYLNTMENALDGGHLAFVHSASLPGTPELATPYDLVFTPDGRGFTGHRLSYDNQRPTSVTLPVQSKLSGARLAAWAIRPFMQSARLTYSTFTYDLNGIVYFESRYANGKTDFTYSFFTPIDEQTTMAIGGLTRDRAMNPIGDLVIRQFMDKLMAEDKEMLAHMTAPARGAGGLPRPFLVRGDYTSAPFRRIYGNALRRESKPLPWMMPPAATPVAEAANA